MAKQRLIKGRPVIIKFCADETSGQITEIKHLFDINTMAKSPETNSLSTKSDIARLRLTDLQPLRVTTKTKSPVALF